MTRKVRKILDGLDRELMGKMEAMDKRAEKSEPPYYYVRCESTLDVVAGPFLLLEARAHAWANADAFHTTYAVILPETDDKGARTYVADVVSLCYPS